MLAFILIMVLLFESVPATDVPDISASNTSSAYEESYASQDSTSSDTSSNTDYEQEYDFIEKYNNEEGIPGYDYTEDYEYENTTEDWNAEDYEYVTYETTGYEIGENIVDGRYVYNTHIFTDRDVQFLGEQTRETFYNLCDALATGNDTFECPDKKTYIYATSILLIDNFFPVASRYIERDGYSDGVGRIRYTIPVDEYLSELETFETEVENLINALVSPDNSDFEKALILYVYMSQNYSYDHDMKGYTDRKLVYPYRTFQSGTGVCVELSGLYSFLLLQCGVQADVMGSGEGAVIEKEKRGHMWSFIRINGIDYHVDTTFGLHKPERCNDNTRLDFFLMSDQQRESRGKYDSDYYIINRLKPELVDNSLYKATDDSYATLQNGYFVSLDTDNNIVYYYDYDVDEVCEFNYYD